MNREIVNRERVKASKSATTNCGQTPESILSRENLAGPAIPIVSVNDSNKIKNYLSCVYYSHADKENPCDLHFNQLLIDN